jgi:hypothetical protein
MTKNIEVQSGDRLFVLVYGSKKLKVIVKCYSRINNVQKMNLF